MGTWIHTFTSVFLGALLALLTSFYLERRTDKKGKQKVEEKKQKKKKNVLLLLKNELESNKQKMEQIIREGAEGVRPYYALDTFAMNSTWQEFTDFADEDIDLISKFTATYTKYFLINRTLDFLSRDWGQPIFHDSTIPLIKSELPNTDKLIQIINQKTRN